MRTLSIETTTHGRVLVRDANGASLSSTLVGFHGYGQNADELLDELERIPGADTFQCAAVQALNRFYGRGEEKVIASWMTRQDRELAITDNVSYVNRVVEALRAPMSGGSDRIIFLGFSQGAAMAYRAALLGDHRVTGIVALGGDIPPDVKDVPPERWPRLFIGAGETDFWYTRAKVDVDVAFLESRRIAFDLVRYRGGHEWTDELREAIGKWITAGENDLNREAVKQ